VYVEASVSESPSKRNCYVVSCMVNHTVHGELLSGTSTYIIQPLSVHSRLKHVGVHRLYKRILVRMFALVCGIIAYI